MVTQARRPAALTTELRRTSGGQEGFGLAFTVGRGNEITVAAVCSLAPLVVGLPVAEVFADLGVFSARLTRDSQLRWLGPEKGVIHMAAAAVVNAVWTCGPAGGQSRSGGCWPTSRRRSWCPLWTSGTSRRAHRRRGAGDP